MKECKIDLSKVISQLLEGKSLLDISNSLMYDMSKLDKKVMEYLLAHDDSSELMCRLLPYANRRQLTDLFYAKRILENIYSRSEFCYLEHITEVKYDKLYNRVCPLIADYVNAAESQEKYKTSSMFHFRSHHLFRVIY